MVVCVRFVDANRRRANTPNRTQTACDSSGPRDALPVTAPALVMETPGFPPRFAHEVRAFREAPPKLSTPAHAENLHWSFSACALVQI